MVMGPLPQQLPLMPPVGPCACEGMPTFLPKCDLPIPSL